MRVASACLETMLLCEQPLQQWRLVGLLPIGEANVSYPPDLECLQGLVDDQAVIIKELADQMAILRTGVIYMMMQASADEVDQTFEGNPWLKMKRDFVRMMNPSIRRLNALLGIKEPDRPDPPKIAVVTK